MTEYDDAYALEQVKRMYGCNNPAGCLERGLHRDTYREAANSDGLTETQRNSPAAAAWAETARQRETLLRQKELATHNVYTLRLSLLDDESAVYGYDDEVVVGGVAISRDAYDEHNGPPYVEVVVPVKAR